MTGRTVWYTIAILVGFSIALGMIFYFSDLFSVKKLKQKAAGPTASPSTIPAPGNDTSESTGQGSVPEVIIADVKQDVKNITSANEPDIKIVSQKATQWSDTSLGCPKPGALYAQVVTPGYLIIAQVGDEQFEYHTNSSDNVILCKTTQKAE